MNIPSIQKHLAAADIPPEQLAKNSQLTEEQKTGEVARQFEAILLRKILESSQKTVIRSEFSDDSTTTSIYHDMVTNQLAESISKSGTMGLAKMLEHQLTRQLHPLAPGAQDAKLELKPLPTAPKPPALNPLHHDLKPILKPTIHPLPAPTH
jgi:Rod binding domain-containing protein